MKDLWKYMDFLLLIWRAPSANSREFSWSIAGVIISELAAIEQ
jgi:hypothetical protein